MRGGDDNGWSIDVRRTSRLTLFAGHASCLDLALHTVGPLSQTLTPLPFTGDILKIKFTHLDEANPIREFSFVINLSERRYKGGPRFIFWCLCLARHAVVYG